MDPVLTGIGIIGQGGSRTISGGSHTQSIVQGGESIIRSDVITEKLWRDEAQKQLFYVQPT